MVRAIEEGLAVEVANTWGLDATMVLEIRDLDGTATEDEEKEVLCTMNWLSNCCNDAAIQIVGNVTTYESRREQGFVRVEINGIMVPFRCTCSTGRSFRLLL